ncbi:MAG: S1C family serine protease [Opitutales bacterium]
MDPVGRLFALCFDVPVRVPVFFLIGWSGLFAQTDFLAVERRIIDLFEAKEDAVVQVFAAYAQPEEERDPEGPPVILRVGTGFFISPDGHILVNASRAYGAQRIWVRHNGVDYAAELLGSDTVNNLSLLRAVSLPRDFDFFRMDSSPVLPEIGSTVLAISCSLDFEPAPNWGLVQGHETRMGQQIFPTTYLRVSIPIHLGEGGSPIIDLRGRLVGILIASQPEIRSSYALPTRALLRLRDDLLFEGEVVYSWIGLEVSNAINRETGEKRVLITEVVGGSPAAETGIQAGDILLQVGDFSIEDESDYPNASFYNRVQDFVEIVVERDGKQRSFTVQTVERPEDEPIILNPDEAAALPDNPPATGSPSDVPPASPVIPRDDASEVEPDQPANPVGPPSPGR